MRPLALLLTVAGVLELLWPRRYLDVATRFAYRDADEVEPRWWVVLAMRVEGALFVLWGLRRLRHEGNATASD